MGKTACATRAVKVLKYLHRTVPATISRSSLQALEKLPSRLLADLHSTSDWNKVTEDAQLKSWFANNPIPSPKAKVSGSLFHGTLVFAQVSFVAPGLTPSGISAADTQTAVNYATLAIVPIQRYASQYGPNSVSVWPVAIPYTARVQGGAFSQDQFEGWVDDVAQFMRKQQVSNPCIVVLHNRDLANSPTFIGERDSYHETTGSGTPYCYSLVFGENLSVADNTHPSSKGAHDKVYAHNLSHEIAEMVVDPQADGSNPEVCDPCSGNCNVSFFDLFDQNSVFMGGTTDTASATGFSFFINSIVRPDAALNSKGCVAQDGDVQSACIYPPPFVDGAIYSTFWDAASGWASGWFEVPGGGTAQPASTVTAIARVSDHLDLFVTGTDGHIYSTYWDAATGWASGWFEIPGGGTAQPASTVTAIARVSDHLDLFVTGTDGHLYSTYWDAASGWAGGWFEIPGGGTAKPGSLVTAIARLADHLDLFVTGTDGHVYSTYWDAASGWASGWFEVPGGGTAKPGSPVTAIARLAGHLDLFVTGTDGHIYSTFWDAASGWASGWFPIGDLVTPEGSVVTAISRDPGHLDLFVTDQAGNISSTFWDAASGWASGWFDVPGDAAQPGSPVTAVARYPDHLDLFVTG